MLYYAIASLYVLTCLVLLLVILLQQGKGGDIASAFGGSSSQTAFGARAGATLLTRVTTVCAASVHGGRAGARDHRAEGSGLRAAGRAGTRCTGDQAGGDDGTRGKTCGAGRDDTGSSSHSGAAIGADDEAVARSTSARGTATVPRVSHPILIAEVAELADAPA